MVWISNVAPPSHDAELVKLLASLADHAFQAGAAAQRGHFEAATDHNRRVLELTSRIRLSVARRNAT